MAIGHWLKNFTKWYFDPGAESGGGGGGGSSDFSVANVTVSVPENDRLYIELPLVVDNAVNVANYAFPNGTETQQVVLYKGKAEVYVDTSGLAVENLSGSVTYEDGLITITGDCSMQLVKN